MPLDWSNRRAWLLQMITAMEVTAADGRAQLKDDLMHRVEDNTRHMWNVESLVLGPGHPPR